MILDGISQRRKYRALLRTLDGSLIPVVSDSHHPACSYGLQHWVADDGNAYGQIDLPCYWYDVTHLQDIGPAD